VGDRIQDLRQVQLHVRKRNTLRRPPADGRALLIRLACTLKTKTAEGRVEMGARRTHILIVDDYPDALDIWTLYLGALGYLVSTAADGATAIAQAEQLQPDLVVLDLELPGISGFEAARRLRRNPATHDIPLIAATGYSHHRQLSMAREAGFDQVLVKPVDPETLVQEIERLLDRHVAVRQPIHFSMERAQENG
jgi:CheY-like chemotaxis protein